MFISTFLQLISARRMLRLQRSIRTAKTAAKMAEELKLVEIGRNAAAYGFEIGAFAAGIQDASDVPLLAEVTVSQNNPFLDPKRYASVIKSHD